MPCLAKAYTEIQPHVKDYAKSIATIAYDAASKGFFVFTSLAASQVFHPYLPLVRRN